ncbi:hypothetical protein [Streptomyces sp. NPDC004579]|uniref:hypothetical protein n=1 Tax=Streptomyces sp. NPDC004579 TaxID=3154667 RepID=UPI0033B329EE
MLSARQAHAARVVPAADTLRVAAVEQPAGNGRSAVDHRAELTNRPDPARAPGRTGWTGWTVPTVA